MFLNSGKTTLHLTEQLDLPIFIAVVHAAIVVQVKCHSHYPYTKVCHVLGENPIHRSNLDMKLLTGMYVHL
jgi:hypothetical protein